MDNVAKDIPCKIEESNNNPTKELKSNVCKAEFSEEKGNCICTIPKQKKLVSDVCQKRLTDNETASLESQQHNGKSKCVCEICNKILSCHVTLVNHYRSMHTGERAFSCDVCGKCFISRSFLNVHYKYHTAEKVFNCDVCPRVFLLKESLDVHSSTHHAKEKKFKCEFCEKSFINSSSLKYHCTSHVTEEHFPSKTFKQKSSLSDDFGIHTKQISPSKCDKNTERGDFVQNTKRNLSDLLPKTLFRCLICKRCFGRKKLFEKHCLTHTSKRSFVCPICKKAFKAKQTMVKHYRFHTREKPYKCDVCDKGFYDTRDLKHHVVLNHAAGKQA